MGDGRLTQPERTGHIDRHDLLPFVLRYFGGVIETNDTRRIAEDVEATERCDRVLHCRDALLPLGDVGHMGNTARATGFKIGASLLQAVAEDVDEKEGYAVGREGFGDGATEAACGAGDQRHAGRVIVTHGMFLNACKLWL